MIFNGQAKSVTAWLGSSDSSTVFIRHGEHAFGWIFILVLKKILLMEKISAPWNIVKGTWNRLLKKIKNWGRIEL